ncbi:hypothetical protein BD626DRAFT_161745 [Schizophyllum amplum]|uniref:Uncharacterized protein n=1 Tax=Schizophyllum amplum TaxID=97359 RepID=A0A550CPA5_9AGAR|nr:hypothetical protein BD626DRAFT_161745 [Auriculariopsis ampla]
MRGVTWQRALSATVACHNPRDRPCQHPTLAANATAVRVRIGVSTDEKNLCGGTAQTERLPPPSTPHARPRVRNARRLSQPPTGTQALGITGAPSIAIAA